MKQPTKDVHLPLSQSIKQILNDLLETYKVIPCAGIAANQIGYDKKIFIGLKKDDYEEVDENSKVKKKVIGNPNADNFEFYINPQIDYSTKKSIQEGEEGCLSIPEIRLIAERFESYTFLILSSKYDFIALVTLVTLAVPQTKSEHFTRFFPFRFIISDEESISHLKVSFCIYLTITL